MGIQGDSGAEVAALVAGGIVDVPDFPQAGIVFKDLSPLFADGQRFRAVIDAIVAASRPAAGAAERSPRSSGRNLEERGTAGFDVVVGIEARGFVLAAAVAYATGVGVVPVRKAGKLPRTTYAATYQLEYGEATLEVHRDAFTAGARVLVVDDVLATGGTARATLDLIGETGATVSGFTVLVELGFLNGRAKLPDRPVHALLTV